MAIAGTTLFDSSNFENYRLIYDTMPPQDAQTGEPSLINDAVVANILEGLDYENYLKDRYATELVQGTLGSKLQLAGKRARIKPIAQADIDEAQRYLGQQTQDPLFQTPSERLEAARQTIGLYLKPGEREPLKPLEKADPQITTLLPGGTIGPQGVVPFFDKEKAETDYGISQETIFMDEDERTYYYKNNVNPDRYFNAGESAFNEWLVGFKQGDAEQIAKDTAADPTGLISTALLAATPLANQLKLDPSAPWKLKAAVGLPSNPTPREMEFVMKNEFPNIVGRIRYIDPDNKEAGLAVRVPKRDGTGDEFIPLYPQFGMGVVGEGAIRLLAEETGTIAAELLMGGGYRGIANIIRKGGQEVSDQISKEIVRNNRFGRRVARGGIAATRTSVSTALGRYAQLISAREAGLNNISEERAFEDAKVAAAFAGLGAGAMSAAMGTVTTIYRVIAGSDIPSDKLIQLQEAINKLRLPRRTTPEFTNEELMGIAKKVGLEAGKNLDLSKLTVGQLTGDAEFQILEQELFAELVDLGYESTDLFRETIMGNRDVAFNMWRELTKYAPAFKNIKLNDFQNYLKEQQEKQLKLMREAAALEGEEIRKVSQLGEQLQATSPLLQTNAELASPFLENVETGNLVFNRSGNLFLLQSDGRFLEKKNAYENALLELGDIKYDRKTDSTNILGPAFQTVLDAGDREALIKTIGDVETATLIKDLIPMRDGDSILRKLTGQLQDPKTKKFTTALDLSYSDLVSMRNAVENILFTHPDGKVKAAVKPLLQAIDDQAMDLLRFDAIKKMKAEGISSPTAAAVDRYIENSDAIQKVLRARDDFDNYKSAFDRTYLKNLSEQSSPEKLTAYVLTSTPEQIEGLLQNIYANVDGVVKLQNIRQLVLNDIAQAVDPKASLVEQNKQWAKYFEQYEPQLEALFPGSQFLKLKDFSQVQQQGVQQLDNIDEGIKALEKELDIEMSFSNFVREVLLAGQSSKLQGKDDIYLEQLQKLYKKYPELKPVVYDMTKALLRRKMEGIGLSATGTREASERMFNETGAFDFAAFTRFVSEAEESGPTGGEQFAHRISQLLGPDIGNKFARQLRSLDFIFKKLQNASPDQVLDEARKGLSNTLEQNLSLYSALQRIFVSPLSKTSRQLTFLKEKLTKKAASDLLIVMTDPAKLDTLIRSRGRAMNYKEFMTFISGLAAARVTVPDIGSERGETEAERREKTLDLERDESAMPTGEVDTLSRITDRIAELSEEYDL